MKKLIVIAFLLFGHWLHAQHNDFQSLYMYDALTINPAYAGLKGALVLNANYRDQWGGIKGSPKTVSFTGHLLLKSKKTGLGVVLVNDRFGIQNNLKLNAVYAYKIRLKKNELSLGLAGGIRNQSADVDALNLNTSSDEVFLNQPRQTIVPDFTFGAMFKSSHWLAGFSLPNIVRIEEKSAQQAANGHIAVLLDVNSSLKIKPSGLIKYAINSPLSYEGNLTFYYKNLLSAGSGLRNDQTLNFHLKANLNGQLSIAYLYERNLGTIGVFLKNTHEFMINYTFDYKTNVQSPRYF